MISRIILNLHKTSHEGIHSPTINYNVSGPDMDTLDLDSETSGFEWNQRGQPRLRLRV